MTDSDAAPADWYESSLGARRVMEISALLNAAVPANFGTTNSGPLESTSAAVRTRVSVSMARGTGQTSGRLDRDRMNTWPESSGREPRAPRLPYTEEARFFIMYARIVEGRGWPDIENHFDKLFGTRSKGGLTSVYYRIRKLWGLQEVLRTETTALPGDREVVHSRAMNFTRDFLLRIGYSPLK